jgi:hypothetical protein
MAITLRQNKPTALSHAELDGNFIDLDGRITGFETDVSNLQTDIGTLQTDVAAIPSVTDGTTNINVNSVTTSFVTTAGINATDIDVTDKIEINVPAGKEISDANFQSGGTGFRSNLLERYAIQDSQANSGLVSVWLHSDFSDLSAGNNTISDGKGAGAWSQLTIDDGNGSDFELYTGGIQWKTREVTDINNFETHCSIHTYTRTGGGPQTAADMLTLGKSETKFENTDRVAMYAPLKVAHYTQTEIASLAAHDGSIIFNTTSNQFQGWDGSHWVNLGYTG